MKSIISVFTLTAFLLSLSVAVLAQGSSSPGSASPDTSAAKESKAQEKAEEKTETKAQEKAEAKPHKMHVAAVDLNSASKEDLMKVKGVTDEIAEKIMAGRPYKSKGELLSKKILTKAEYKKIRGKVTVKKEKAASK